MESVYGRPVVRKKTICKSTSSFGFSDVTDAIKDSKMTNKRSFSQERPLSSETRDVSCRKIIKLHKAEGANRDNSSKKLLAAQKEMWRLKTKTEREVKENEVHKRKENLRELHERSKILLKENLEKKTMKRKVDKKSQRTSFIPSEHNLNTSVISISSESIDDNNEKVNPNSDDVVVETEAPVNNEVPIVIENSVAQNAAATIIQKHYRGYLARKNVKDDHNTSAPIADAQPLIPDNVDPSQTPIKSNVATLPNLYVDYPFNIMSSVKTKLCTLSDVESNKSNSHNTKAYSSIETKMVNITSTIHDKTTPMQQENISIETKVSNAAIIDSVKKNNNVLSSLKSSLEEIQNLTSSFNFKSAFPAPETIASSEISTSTKSNTSVNYRGGGFKDKGNLLNAPEVNLIWLRRSNKKTVSPHFLQNSFQDELNLLESFNDSLRQVQNIEKSLTSIRKEDTSFSDFESVQEYQKDVDDSTGITFLGSSDISIINKFQEKNIDEEFYEKLGRKSMRAPMNSKQFMVQKYFDNDKSLILSQRDNVSRNLTNTSDIYSSESESVIEKNIESCTSSMIDVTNPVHMFDYKDFKNTNVSSRLNKFCLCLVSQYIEDEKVRSEYLSTLLKVREKTLLDATRNELLCLEMQKKHNHAQIPLLKKKQRGLLLKLQQERNEIKHIKKFQQQQSQERKASLRRQLKHLKQMLACDESLFTSRRKQKNTSALLNASKCSLTSPLKSINIALDVDIQNSNGSTNKLWENLEKRRQDLNDEKKKMHDLLHLHFNNIFDSAEIKVIQEKISKSPYNTHNVENKDSLNLSNAAESLVNNALPKSVEKEDAVKTIMKKNDLDLSNNNKQWKCFNGSMLNGLWENITGHRCDKYEGNKMYNMSKDSLDSFFNEAKQVAIDNMLSPLQHNVVNVEPRKPDPIGESLTHCLNSNKMESTSFINNLLKSEGRELADLISKDKEAQQELLNKNENYIISNESLYSGNLSNDGSEPSDTSKSTARSLVEELSYLYPNAGNSNESENESNSADLPAQLNTQCSAQHNQNNCQAIDSNTSQNENGTVGNKGKEIPTVKEENKNFTLQEDKKSIVLDENKKNTDKSSPSVQQKPAVSVTDTPAKSNTDVSVEKTDSFVDNRIDMSNKQFYADDGNISRFLEYKSPVNTEYLSGSWESVSPSPDPSPRDSPTGEYSPAAASMSPLCHLTEAEELRRKQLAIELEIKALEQQQTQLPYCLVREIPDKPPPPYIPPSDETKAIISLVKTTESKSPPSISSMIESFCSWLWSKFSSGKTELITYNDYCGNNKVNTNLQDYTFIFDVCFETYQNEFSNVIIDTTPALPWEYKKEAGVKNDKTDKVEMSIKVENKVKELIGVETKPIRENLIISWTQKRQDFVNNLLIKELYKEEADWLNIEPFEFDVKNNLTNSILDTLIIEMCNELKTLIF